MARNLLADFIDEYTDILNAMKCDKKCQLHFVRYAMFGEKLRRPKVIIFVDSQSRALDFKQKLTDIAAKYKKTLKLYVDKIGSVDVLISEKSAQSARFVTGSTIKDHIRMVLPELNRTVSWENEWNIIKNLDLKEEPIYALITPSGTNYSYTYFSGTQNKRVHRSVGDVVILWSDVYTNLIFHHSTTKQRSDRFVPNKDNCVYYNENFYIRERIEKSPKGVFVASGTTIEADQNDSVPTIKLPKCPYCGGKIVIVNGRNGQFLSCENWRDKGCKCDYKLNNYIKITY